MLYSNVIFCILQQVLSAIGKANANPRLRSLLQQIKNFSNIPRKKAKFEVLCFCMMHALFYLGIECIPRMFAHAAPGASYDLCPFKMPKSLKFAQAKI